jgi:uncharacterized membrane protein (UPF0182 family)
MVARSDGDHYGQLLVFQFPKQTLVFGPRQVVGRINQDQVIAPQITLWNQQGSEVIQGTLMVIPVEESLLYVRPLYLRAQAGRIPELTRVIVNYKDQIVMERTLEAGLARIFGGDARSPDSRVATTGAGGAAPSAPGAPAAPAAPAAPEGRTAPAAPDTPSTPDAFAAEARATYERAIAAQKAGDWAKYGEEIRRLGEILAKMQ